MDINITNACEFLRDKGLDTENYVILDTSGYYKQQIALATWLEEYHQSELKKLDLHFVSGQLTQSKVSDKEYNDLLKALYPKDNSKKFRR